MQAVIDGKSWMYFVRVGDQLAGMVGAYQDDDDKENGEAEVIAVYVDQGYRGQKQSRLLMESLLHGLT